MNKKSKRIVIKIGTGALRVNGQLSDEVFFNLAAQIAAIKKEGFEVAVISSGAVDAGKAWLSLLGRDFSVFDSGELSSIGTSELLERWKRAFVPHGLAIATAWLTHSVWTHRSQRMNLRKSGGKLSGLWTVPIVNENDLLSRSELRGMVKGVGDNDYLARRVACLLEAEAILFLTECGGIWNGNPAAPETRMFRQLDGRKTYRLGAKNGGASKTGTGGPQSKINQASICFRRGMRAAIAGVDESLVVVRFAHEEFVGTTIGNRTSLSD